MSKSPYLINPNILAHPDRIVHNVELDMEAQESYLAGSPISATGKLANDATAFGILLYDVHASIGGHVGTVVISGYIQQDVAAEWSGITISDAAKSAMINVLFTDDGSRSGASSWEDLGEGVVVLVDNATVECISEEENYLDFSLTLIDGATYTVIWDDVSYSCVAASIDGLVCLGNYGPLIGGEATPEPFLMGFTDGMSLVMADVGTHTVTISGLGINHIDRRYIPNPPTFNLQQMGISSVSDSEVTLECDTSEMREAFESGGVFFLTAVEAYTDATTNTAFMLKIYASPIKDTMTNDHFWFVEQLTPYTTFYLDVTETGIKAKVVHSVSA